MTHNISLPEYLKDPCGTCSTAFWKNTTFIRPDNTQIIHEKELSGIEVSNSKISRYFRLYHNLRDIVESTLPNGLLYQTVNLQNDLDAVCRILNQCYPNMNINSDEVIKWTQYKAFCPDLWVFICKENIDDKIALAIADYDNEASEISLEWVQVLPEYQKQGLGTKLVNELLNRACRYADFATVSGQVDNVNHPEFLSRKCGFTGKDIRCLIHNT